MAEHREVDVRRPPRIVVIAPRIGAGLDGDELVIALVVALGSTGAGEIRIERRGMLVDDMDIAAAGIGLPQLDQCVRHAAAILVEHMAMHDDALAERLTLGLDGEVVVVLAYGLMTIDRPGQFRERMPNRDQRLLRRAFHGGAIGRRQPRRMGRKRLQRIQQGHGEFLRGPRAR